MAIRKTPKLLYKYRAFSALTVDLLVSDKVFFADPQTFNDPLDSKPIITADLTLDQLKLTVRTLMERRLVAEMTTAARSIKYRGPKTIDHIDRLSRQEVEGMMADIAYHATNPDYEGEFSENHRWLLGHQLQTELMKQYDRGILSFAERNSCPLMWSHYGDQHNGLCIGYRVPMPPPDDLHKVKYGGSRLVEASRVAGMLNDDVHARAEVDAAVFLRKAGDWRYEKEWRLIGERGLVDSPLELADVTFGFRCLDSVKATVIKALEGRSEPVKFYEMREIHGTFRLKRIAIDTEELAHHYPRRARDASDAFS